MLVFENETEYSKQTAMFQLCFYPYQLLTSYIANSLKVGIMDLWPRAKRLGILYVGYLLKLQENTENSISQRITVFA